jgi:Xaa-Pro aminopeptidase
VTTNSRFPVYLADALARAGIEVTPDEPLFVERRRIKATAQLAGMRRSIRAVVAGWDAIRQALRAGDEVTSEELQVQVLTEVAAHDAIAYDMVIVPSGPDSTLAHGGGSGLVRAGEPLIADLILRDRATGIYADLTRTFTHGRPTSELGDYFRICRDALHASVAAVAAGVLATDVNAVASEIFERAGYPTLRRRQRAPMDSGFWHSLGHGVGFEVHEPPSISHGPLDSVVAG